MILPAQIKEHLKGPKSLFVGTRDKDFNCDAVRVLGGEASGHDSIKFFIAEKTASKTLDNLRLNKIVSLSVTNIFTSESYHFKGRFLSVKATSEEEAKTIFGYIGQFDEAVSSMGYPKGLVADHIIYNPAIAIEFVVDQIFDQTPKVGAGQKLTTV